MDSCDELTEITWEQAAEVCTEFIGNADLALSFVRDGCFARTHIMVRRLTEKGFVPKKIWAFAASAVDPLWVIDRNRKLSWGYHVAPLLWVRLTTGVCAYVVVDPVLADSPMQIDQWVEALHDSPRVVQTAIGAPPLPHRGGSGYWPGPDPFGDLDFHAINTLEIYARNPPE